MGETIAAISTAFGEGGIGIIRISGTESERILKEIFVPVSVMKDRRLTYGKVMDPENGSVIDEVLAVFMKEPHTYTGEAVAEIDCHGSVVSLRRILSLCYAHGARPAERGEFTKRAFLNGRIDLSQAEAVIDVIRAKTDRTYDVAMDHLQGGLSGQIRQIRRQLMDLLVQMTVNIDYPDEDIEEIVYEDLQAGLKQIEVKMQELLDSADTGRMIHDGLRISIIGRPNVGKSSLMNALLKESRAIVTEIPGTTRDIIEEMLSIRSIPVILTDTAGIREDTDDRIEQIGIEKSRQSVQQADLVLFLLDGSLPLEQEDITLLRTLQGHRVLVLLNKSDLGSRITEQQVHSVIADASVIATSMSTGQGLSELEDHIEQMVYHGTVKQENSLLVTSARHEHLIRRSQSAVRDAMTLTGRNEPLEIIEIDLHQAYEWMGEIIGESVTDDVLNEVFSRFCLGK